MTYAVDVDHVTVNYDHLKALSDIQLSVEENEFLTIMGPNGGGKTTLIRTLLGLHQPTYGNIKVFGKQDYLKKGWISYVPQFATLRSDFPISVHDSVLTSRYLSKKWFGLFRRYSKEDHAQVEEQLNFLALAHLQNRRVDQLSGGQMQRILIARALVADPKILVLDEPTANVDAKSRQQIYQTLLKLKGRKTIILISHDTDIIGTYTDSVACLNQSLLYHGGTDIPEEIIKKLYGVGFDAQRLATV